MALALAGSVGQAQAETVISVTQIGYDANLRPICTAVRMDPAQWGSQSDACVPQANGPNGPDRITKNVYDKAGQLVQVRKAVGTGLEQAYVTYSYTRNGKQEDVIDANGQRTRLAYDGFDRQTHWYFPAKAAVNGYNSTTQEAALATAGAYSTSDYEQYGYDANGNRTSLRKRGEAGQAAGSQTINYTYDVLNRVTKKDLPGSEQDVYYVYDLRGLQTRARFGSIDGAGITNEYDGLGRLSSSTNTSDGVSRALLYEYDANGNRTKVTHPDVTTYFTYAYDGLDRVTSIKENGTTELVGITYDNQGRRDLMTYANGTKVDYGYDAVSRLASLNHDLEGTGTSRDVLLEYKGYNPASQLLERKVYNDLYVYRGDVNLNRGYTANGLNQYTVSGPRSLDYDLNGNMKLDQASVNPDPKETFNYQYDSENRLTSVWGKRNATLSYDPLGRLLQITGGGAAATHFLYDGDALVGEYKADGALLKRYVHGPGVDEPLVWYNVEQDDSVTKRWLHADHQGSIIGVTDSAGNAMGTYQANTYDAYGIPAGLEWGPTTNYGLFQYTGQIWLPELEMYHYKARIYSPQLGRFLQTDPIGYDDQINLYAYVGNDPANMHDPEGKSGRAVTSGARWTSRVYRYSGNFSRATRETVKEISTDWHALDTDAKTTTWDKIKASADLIIGTNLYNPSEIYDVDRTGKIKNPNPAGIHVGDSELEDAVSQLNQSIDRRRAENDRFPRGNPNGNPEDKRNYQRYRDHAERISREESVRDRLRERLRNLNE